MTHPPLPRPYVGLFRSICSFFHIIPIHIIILHSTTLTCMQDYRDYLLSSGAVRVMVGVRMCVCMNILRLRTKTKTRDMRYPSSSSSYLVYPSSSYPSSLRSPHLNPFSPVFPAFLPTSLSPLVIFLTSSLGLRLRGQP